MLLDRSASEVVAGTIEGKEECRKATRSFGEDVEVDMELKVNDNAVFRCQFAQDTKIRGVQCRSWRGRTLNSSSFVYVPENYMCLTYSSARKMKERRQSTSFLSEPWHIKQISTYLSERLWIS